MEIGEKFKRMYSWLLSLFIRVEKHPTHITQDEMHIYYGHQAGHTDWQLAIQYGKTIKQVIKARKKVAKSKTLNNNP